MMAWEGKKSVVIGRQAGCVRDFQSSPVRRTDAKSSKTRGVTSSGCLEKENREDDFCWKPKESVLNLVLDLCLIPILLLLILDLGFRL